MPRIDIFSTFFWPSVGGVEITTDLLASAVAQQYPDTHVVTYTSLNGISERAYHYQIHRLNSLFHLMRRLRHSDVIIVKGGFSLPPVLIGYLRSKPVIIWHEMAGPIIGTNSLLKRILFQLFRKKLVHSAIHVAVSRACLSSKGLPNDAEKQVLYNPISPELEDAARKFLEKPQPKVWDLLFVGRLVEWKGVYILLEALTNLDKKGCCFTVAFAGDGPLTGAVASVTKEWRNLRAILLGNVSHAALATVYQKSRVLVFPSLWPEGMGLVPVEAMAFGVPVIGARHKAIVEVVESAGLFVEPGSVAELADAIEGLLGDHTKLDKLAKQAILRARHYSFSEYSQRVTSLVRKICPVDPIAVN